MHGCMKRNAPLLVLLLYAVPSGSPAYGQEHRADAGRARPVELVAIPAGTLVGDKPPATWSHLVVKSLPRLASGDLETLPRSAFRTATLIRTVILADVGPTDDDPSRYALRRVGIGLSIPVRSRGDVVVESNRLNEVGVRLGMMEKIVLQSAEAELARGRLISQGPTFALYSGPTVLEVSKVHHKVVLSYALLVDRQNGALRVLVWSEEARKDGQLTIARLVELRPNLVFDCPLNVKAERLLGAVPVSWSFAMESLPPGQTRTITPDLESSLAKDPRSRDLAKLEQSLRRALNEQTVQVHRASAGS